MWVITFQPDSCLLYSWFRNDICPVW